MHESIRGEPSAWTPEIKAMWDERVVPSLEEGQVVNRANYFTPRPWRNEYDRGSAEEGFVYTIGRSVYRTDWIPPARFPCR